MSLGVCTWGWFSSAMSRATWGWAGVGVPSGGFIPVGVVPSAAFKAAPAPAGVLVVGGGRGVRTARRADHAGSVNRMEAAYTAMTPKGGAAVSRDRVVKGNRANARGTNAKSGRQAKRCEAAKAVIKNQKP